MQPVKRAETLYEQVLDAVRTAIIDGRIAPGSILSAAEIASWLDVSRSPAREAILQLQNEGLVTVVPRRGAVVLEGGVADIEQIFEFREPLEGMAAALAADRIDADGIARLEAAFEAHASAVRSGDLDAHLERDEEFHQMFIETGGNERISDALQTVRRQLRVLTRRLSAETGARDEVIIGAHRAIFEAIRDGDRRKAEHAARAHVRGVLRFYRDHLPSIAPSPDAPSTPRAKSVVP